MARFLIEVPHEGTKVACQQAIDVFLSTGSHFLSHAEWGCNDGEHKAWIIVDVDSKDDARTIVPPIYRSDAKIVELTEFSMEDLDGMMGDHEP